MAKQLRIGFIQATNDIDVQWYRPLSFGYLKAYLDKYLDGAVDMKFLISLDNIGKFDIIGISSTSQDFFIAKEIAKKIKENNKDIIVILGGHHITYLPETLSEEFDIGVIGEGEETFLELIRYFFDRGLMLKPEDLKNIRGIVFRENGSIVSTSRRDLIVPLDKIPFPYRSKGSESVPYFFTSRGCPYKCAFCSSSAFWEKTRFFSAEYVVSEIEHVLKQFPGLKHISIWDDLFIVNKSRFKRFIQLVEERNINSHVSFNFSIRANLVDDELCEALKKINVVTVAFGAESGSDRILKLLNKGITVEINQKAINTLHKHGIKVGCSFIVGSPTETEEDVRNTYEFILKNILDEKFSPICSVNIMMPMPGTEMWNYAVKSNIVDLKNMHWENLAIFASYRDSRIKNFDAWLECRKKNNSIYMAEDTLPQKRLYELMHIYEGIMKVFEKNMELNSKVNFILPNKPWKFTNTIRRIIDFLKGKQNVKYHHQDYD